MRGETLFDHATADLPGDVREGLLRLLLHLKADLDDPMMVGMAVAGHSSGSSATFPRRSPEVSSSSGRT